MYNVALFPFIYECITCKMQSFPNMSLFVYNIWWMILKKAAIWMEMYEFQRMNKKSIKLFDMNVTKSHSMPSAR